MDRKIILTQPITLAPGDGGWRFYSGTRWSETFASFAEAAAALPPGGPVWLALPSRLAILERFTLPASDPAELEGMVDLQLEKTLPYPVEETVHGFQSVRENRGEGEEAVPETDVVACAVHRPALETLCAPLLKEGRYPERVTLRAMQVAAAAPRTGPACGIWIEEGEIVFAVFEEGVLTFLETLPAGDDLPRAFSQALLSAELAGASTRFCVVLLDPGLERFSAALADAAETSVETLAPASPPGEGSVDLTLESWRAALAQARGREALKRKITRAAMLYGALLVLALVYLGLQSQRVKRLDARLVKIRPEVDAALARQARWRSLEPAVDSRYFTVELLYQIFESLPSGEVRITKFDHSPNQLQIEGEAPSVAEAVAFAEALKTHKALGDFQFEAAQPSILSNEHAQFRIFGKR